MSLGRFAVLSRACRVIWDAWGETTTHRLQGCGWELAESVDSYSLRRTLAIHHRDLGITALAISNEFRRLGDEPPTFLVQTIFADKMSRIRLVDAPSIDSFLAIDAAPRFLDLKEEQWDPTRIFAPAASNAPEIIVDPHDVNDLLERIRTLQEPQQAEIRARNRQRDRMEARRFHAQIVSIAA